jgi:hypothetical protein
VIVEEKSNAVPTLVNPRMFSEQFVNNDQWTTGFTRGVFAWTAKEIEKLQGFAAKSLRVKEYLEPSANVTAVD